MKGMAELLAIQYVLDHGEYGNIVNSDNMDPVDALVRKRTDVLLHGAGIADYGTASDMVRLLTDENGNIRSTEEIKEGFLQHTGRKDILTEEELRPDYYWHDKAVDQAEFDRKAVFSQEEIDPDTARFHLATALALGSLRIDPRASQETVRRHLENNRDAFLKDSLFQRTTENKSGKEIAALCGEFDPESKQFTSFSIESISGNYTKAFAAVQTERHLGQLQEIFKKEPFDRSTARNYLANLIVMNRVREGELGGQVPTDANQWSDVEKVRNKLRKDPVFLRITKKNAVGFATLCGGYDPNTKQFKPFTMEDLLKNYTPVYDQERERAEKAAQEKAEREQAEREAQEEAERERAEKEAQEKAERERAEREEREKAERERAEKAAQEKAEREQAEREAQEEAERERAEKEEREKAERERAEREEREKREAQEKEAEAAQKPVTMQDYLLGKAGESIKAALDLIPDSPDWGDEKEKEEVFRHLSTARATAYFAQRPDIAPRTIEGMNLEKRLGEMEMWANMQMHGQLFQGAFGSETPQGIKNFLTDPEKERAPVSPAELLERYNERIKDVVITVDVDQAPWLNNEQPEQQPEQKPEQQPEQKPEQEPEQKPEQVQEQEPEQEPEELSDEAVAGLGMTEVANKLYTELAYLSQPLSAAYGNGWFDKVLDAQQLFLEENYKDSNGFKKSVEEAQKFLGTKLSGDKTIADFAKENKLLGGNFEKLMKRAVEIASMERQAEEEQPEAEEEQPEAEEEQEQPERTDEQSADLDKSVVVHAPVRKTAAKWIEGYKERLATKVKGKEKGDNYPAADIALIFAARELSNSVRGKASTLNTQMTNAKIQARAAKIMANKSFKDFAEKLSKGENLSKVEAIFTKTHSHGGELDDLFRDYLTKRPAGELKNDPDLKRWMPTVKKRVEFLQSEAAKTQKENKTPYKEAAEILMLRQAADVKRGGKGLEANVPVAGDKGVKSLSEAVEKYADNVEFKAAFDKPDVKKYILAGHGGEMVERLKKTEAEIIKQDNDQELGK